jgi:putative redox protein
MSDEWKEVVAEWRGELSFLGKNAAGGTVQIGALGDKPGIGPMEMLLLGAAGCTGMDIVNILEKKRQKLHDFQVRVRGKRAAEHPKVYTDIEVTYLLWGENLDPKGVEQAIQLSEEKYCSASVMLGAVAKIVSSYRILPPGEKVEQTETLAGG